MQGLSNPQIAERLGIARRTVDWFVSQIYRRHGVHSRALRPRAPRREEALVGYRRLATGNKSGDFSFDLARE